MRKMLAAFLFLACAATGNAQTTVPFTFSAGSPARASEVNGNFQALVNALNSLTARVAKLEGQITTADLVGTYRMMGLFVALVPTNRIETVAHNDTLTLAADGTYSATLDGNGFALNIPGPRAPNTDIGPINGTWTFTANGVVLTGPLSGSFAHAAGGRVLVHSGFDSAGGVTDMFVLLRSN